MSTEKADRLIAEARQTNLRRDECERSNGFAAPGDSTTDSHLRTAMDAIYCGLSTNDLSAVAEGWVMLDDIHARMTGQPRNPPTTTPAS